eukprot:3067613-Amphidinium_carterae.1
MSELEDSASEAVARASQSQGSCDHARECFCCYEKVVREAVCLKIDGGFLRVQHPGQELGRQVSQLVSQKSELEVELATSIAERASKLTAYHTARTELESFQASFAAGCCQISECSELAVTL